MRPEGLCRAPGKPRSAPVAAPAITGLSGYGDHAAIVAGAAGQTDWRSDNLLRWSLAGEPSNLRIRAWAT